ncbi:Lpg1974 family pore-forming outer membrane protein [Hyphomicrobium sp.]|uniref:Lpg1974 family pore-forming outer membrane protein n=1 Tax=Hyphomicrobium sp. TaxID=82 RepID=UPI002E358ADF|nr:Lpg1974 family pore-forming outer membrane protein [Hyphomicrobium sp.]HEX2843264.1 Lpg1974 family pore-forming outer membrane protein [Hyphomicrobium sp.]
MGIIGSHLQPFVARARGKFVLTAAAAMLCVPAVAVAQTASVSPGFYVEAEGQRVFGASDFEAGFVPTSLMGLTGPQAKLDEGDGWGGAAALGYTWSSGWSAAVRYRRLEADDRGGPYDPGIMAFAPSIPFVPGGIPFGVLDATTEVDSQALFVDVEVGKDLSVSGGRLQLFGGVSYASIERDVAIKSDDCGCIPFALRMGNDFHGVGPKIGFRGGLPLNGTISVVGGGSVAALFGTSKFTSRLDDPLFPPNSFKDSNDRTVAALDAHAGLAIGVGFGTLTLGYRIDAVIGALDTDQRVSALVASTGYPQIGDRHDDFVEHGPFARFTLPIASGND